MLPQDDIDFKISTPNFTLNLDVLTFGNPNLSNQWKDVKQTILGITESQIDV